MWKKRDKQNVSPVFTRGRLFHVIPVIFGKSCEYKNALLNMIAWWIPY